MLWASSHLRASPSILSSRQEAATLRKLSSKLSLPWWQSHKSRHHSRRHRSQHHSRSRSAKSHSFSNHLIALPTISRTGQPTSKFSTNGTKPLLLSSKSVRQQSSSAIGNANTRALCIREKQPALVQLRIKTE